MSAAIFATEPERPFEDAIELIEPTDEDRERAARIVADQRLEDRLRELLEGWEGNAEACEADGDRNGARAYRRCVEQLRADLEAAPC